MNSNGNATGTTAPARHRWRRWAIGAAILAVAGAGGIVAWYLTNFFTVVDGKVYRSAQPSPDQIKLWASKYGIKTVLNLRGQSEGTRYEQEKQACAAAGVEMIDLRCSAEDLPSSLWLRRLIETLESAKGPILIHCQAGSDRTGVASVIAAMAIGGQDYRQAKGQLSIRFGHVDNSPSHIGGVLAEYEKYQSAHDQPANWEHFRSWAMKIYHPLYFNVEITVSEADRSREFKTGESAVVEVTVTNRSSHTIPAGEANGNFTLACFEGSSLDQTPERELGQRVPLPKSDIPPGKSLKLSFKIEPFANSQLGQHKVHFDVVEEGKTWFSRQGSPVPTFEWTVVASP